MRIEQQYLQDYLYDIAIRQLTAQYESKGYAVAHAQQVGGTEADLVARKADEVVVMEIKVGKMSPEKRARITRLGDYVKEHKNYKFVVILSTPPKPKKIDIPNLDGLLFDYLVDHFPDELNRLSSHTRIEGVEDATVDELSVIEGGLHVKGGGTVEVELRYGPTQEEAISYDSFPFSFDLILKQMDGVEPIIDQVRVLTVDTSSFYE